MLGPYAKRKAREMRGRVERSWTPDHVTDVRTWPYNPCEHDPLQPGWNEKRCYRGDNAVKLWLAAKRLGIQDMRWLTRGQVEKLGGEVRTGARGVPIKISVGRGTRVFVIGAVVYSVEQCRGLDRALQRLEPQPHWKADRRVEDLVRALGVRVRHLDGPSVMPGYQERSDEIIMPVRDRFKRSADYEQALLHEIAHWWMRHHGYPEKHKHHPEYFRQELAAESLAFLLGGEWGVVYSQESSAAYVDHYVELLGGDPREIFRAFAVAENIRDDLVRSLEKWRAESYQPRTTRPLSSMWPLFRTSNPLPQVAGAFRNVTAREHS